MPDSHADRNLLFGVLALQADLLDAAQFAEACSAWAGRKGTPLADLLVERGWLTPQDREDVQRLLERKLKKHGGDAQASLAAVAGPEVRRALDTIDDADVQRSLASLGPANVHASDLPTIDALPAAGRYRVLRPHAKGGLGEVFVAEDTELHRNIALKQIQRHHADDRSSRGRFLLEAEITGGLEHPGIVPVYGLGLYPDGRPFYAMRLIKGESLKEAVQRFHAAPDFRGAAFRQLLRRFLDVCNAVAYAHSRGVLHRDLKPANVMLGPFGETLVVDWGLAKVVGRQNAVSDGDTGEPTLQPASASSQAETVAGTALGTPAFMSPEQAAGRLDDLGPASDVYGLGATLYAVLTGRAPFEGSDQGEVLRQVQRGDCPPPRRIQPVVPAALDAVCRKAMAVRATNRYPTPLALAAEVERWLADEPVHAYRDPLAVRLVRWGRRHQKLVTGGTALLLTALLALAVGLTAVERERQQTAAAKAQAEEHFALAQQAVDRYLNEVTDDPHLKNQDFFALRQKVLETAVPFYEQLARAKAGDPEHEAARGRAYHRLALVREQLGERDTALADYEQMRAVFAQLAADFPTVPEYRQKLATSYNNRGILLAELGRRPEAETACRQALALQAQLVDACPAVPAYRQELAHSHNNLGRLLAAQGKLPEAEAEYRRALVLQEQLAADSPAVPEYRQDLAKHHNNLGSLLADLGRRPEAEAHYRQALALREQLAAAFPTVPAYRQELATSHNNLGILLVKMEKQPDAEAEYRHALALRGQLAAEFPTVPAYRQELASSHNNLSILLEELGRRPEAEGQSRQALGLRQQLAADFPTVPQYAVDLGGTYCNFGHLLCGRGEPAASLPWYAKAHAALRPILEKDPRLVTARRFLRNVHWERAQALSQLGRHAEAVADWEQALALNDERLHDGWFRLPQSLALARAGQPRQATAAVEEVLRSGNADSGTLYNSAGVYALAVAEAVKAAPPNTSSLLAEHYARRAMELLREAVGKGYKNVAQMKQDADLDALRQRPDFRQLLADLEAKPSAK
jgi:serine/threonine-protein kinase